MAHSADTKNLVADLAAVQADVRAGGAAGVREGLQHAPSRRPHADGKGAIFDRAERVAIAYSEALDTPGGPGLLLRAQHALFDRLVYGKLRAALGGRAARDLRRRAAGRAARALLPRHRRDHLRGVRPDRDLPGRRGQPRSGTSGSARSAGRCPASPSASTTTARSWSRATSSSRGTGTTRRRPPRRSTPTAGSTPATWASSTTTATCASPAARRRSSSPPAARTSRRPCWRTGSGPTRWSASAWSSATGSRSSPRWSPSTRRRWPVAGRRTASRPTATWPTCATTSAARRGPDGDRRRQPGGVEGRGDQGLPDPARATSPRRPAC